MEAVRSVLSKGQWPTHDGTLTFPPCTVQETVFDVGDCLISSVLKSFKHVAHFLGKEGLSEEQVCFLLC
jgi:hypothetical protein